MKSPGYVARVDAVVRALGVLERVGPCALEDLARAAAAPEEQLRDDLGQLMEDGLVDVTDGGLYAVTGVETLHALGLDRLDESDAAAVVLLGQAWLTLHPDRSDLRGALDVLQTLVLGGLAAVEAAPAAAAETGPVGATLVAAIEGHRRVRIRYARAWEPGVHERTVEPHRLVMTRRGWELDAVATEDRSWPRTFIVSGIESAVALPETFEPADPAMVDKMDRQRRPRTVTLVLPQGSRWVAEAYAERVRVVSADDDLELECDLLPPVEKRVGLILTTAGPTALATDPALDRQKIVFANELLAEYEARLSEAPPVPAR